MKKFKRWLLPSIVLLIAVATAITVPLVLMKGDKSSNNGNNSGQDEGNNDGNGNQNNNENILNSKLEQLIKNNQINFKKNSYNQEWYNNLNESNLQTFLTLDQEIINDNYQVINLTKNDIDSNIKEISFNLKKDDYISTTISLRINIELPPPPPPEPEPLPPPRPVYQFTFTKSNNQDIISWDNANINLSLNVDKAINGSIVIAFKLENSRDWYNATINKIDEFNFELSINFNNLNRLTNYKIEEAKITIDNEEYIENILNDNFTFKTLNNVDSIIALSIKKETINIDEANQVTVKLDQILPININKKIKLKFLLERNVEKFSNELNLINNQLEYTFDLDKFETPGKYEFDGIYILNNNHWEKLNSKLHNEYSFIVNKKIQEQNQDLSNYGNYYDLQVANKYFEQESNINQYTDGTLDKNNLINKNEFYFRYFDQLNQQVSKPINNDTVSGEVVKSNGIKISSIRIDQDFVYVNLQNPNNNNLNNIKFLVKTYDHYANWSKWIDGINISANEFKFAINDLNYLQNKFIITNIMANNETYEVSFNQSNLFSTNQIDFSNLDINNFDVYKDETNKDLYGSIMFNWTKEQIRLLADKVFVLTFKITQKTGWEKYDPFGTLLNPQDGFNPEYSYNPYKKIYVPFNQLHKFKLNSFSERIEYTLTSFEIVNELSYLPYLNQKNVESKKLSFIFNFDWINNNIQLTNQLGADDNVKQITKQELDQITQKEKKPIEVPFSINNLNTALNYNFDVYNQMTRYPEAVEKLVTPNIKFIKDNVKYNFNYFMPRELLAQTIFKINEAKNSATVTKNLNSIKGLDNIDKNNVILWITFELDMNTKILTDWTELNDIHSRIRVPISLGQLAKQKSIQDVDFLFDAISGTKTIQQELYSKIKSNIKMDISLNNNQLTLNLSTRNNNIELNNKLWLHNNSLARSTFINRADLFVNWIQPEDQSQKQLSYQEANKLDDLTIASTAVGYENTYAIEFEPPSNTIVNDIPYPNAKNILKSNPGRENAGKRLFSNQNAAGINEARSRVFSLNKKADGSWNILGKVTNEPDDYRFYAMVNYHVWMSNRGMATNSELANLEYFLKTDSNNKEYIEVKKADLLAPSSYQPGDNNKSPLYIENYETPEIAPTGNLFEFDIPEGMEGIKYSIFMEYLEDKTWGYDVFKDNSGIGIDDTNINNHLDMIVAIVDFKPIFETFKNQNLDTYTYQGRNLEAKEKNAIRYFLNFENLKPIQFSELNYYMHSFSNLNFYLASIPKANIIVNPDGAYASRYREYLIANNTTVLTTTYNQQDTIESNIRPVFETENRYFDIQNGSSGSGIYDHEGKIVGLETQGAPSTIANYVYVDTQKYSYIGNNQTIYNPYTLYNIVDKMSYFYPYKFDSIFKITK